jgi:phage recombination protein Bet
MKNEISIAVNSVTDKELLGHLDNLGLTSKLTENEKNTYLTTAKAFGLNPFKREIHVSKYGQGEYAVMSIITGYEVYIKRAERSGQLDGWHASTTGSVATNDLKATVTIYRKDRNHAFVWEVFYDECVQRKKDGTVTQFWQKANFMTKKVAISQAFRLCFSDELGGMPYTADEMPEQTQDIPHEVVEEPKIIPSLNEKQFQKLLTENLATIEKYLNAAEDGNLNITQVQQLNLEDKLTELRNE